MNQCHVVVLAAGQGTRMKSALPKVLHPVAGLPMIERVLDTADGLAPESTCLVVGHKAELVKAALVHRPHLRYALQEPQRGTAHALQQAEAALQGCTGTLILLSGDVPLLRADTLRSLLERHVAAGAAATVVTAVVEKPFGYGRIVRHEGRIAKIVEERDASPAERQIDEINGGIYAFDLGPLFGALRAVASQNAQGEFYLTDLVGIYRQRNLVVETFQVSSAHEIRGVNSRSELAELSGVVRQAKNEELMAAGVTLVDPSATYIDTRAQVEADTVIHPGVVIEGPTRIGAACEIQPHVRIVNCVIGDHVVINSFCLLVDAAVGARATIGPFAHLRPETSVGEAAKVGNFVELKKTVLGPGSKVNHLSYLGDTTVGAKANIGAGTITCNYDGQDKHQTVIEDGAFIGSDTQLIAPVRIGKGAFVAAGSSITEDVPAGALGIARGRQTNIADWAKQRKSPKGR